MTVHVFAEYREMCGAGANHQYCFISAKSMLTHTALLKSGTSNKMYTKTKGKCGKSGLVGVLVLKCIE